MRVLTPKVVLVVAGIITVFILLALAQETNRRWQVQREVRRLEAEVGDMEKQVVELDQLNQYFRTQAYLERVAREKLNYQAAGEQVVLIPEEAGTADTAQADRLDEERRVPAWLRWWEVFFVDEAPLSEILISSQ